MNKTAIILSLSFVVITLIGALFVAKPAVQLSIQEVRSDAPNHVISAAALRGIKLGMTRKDLLFLPNIRFTCISGAGKSDKHWRQDRVEMCDELKFGWEEEQRWDLPFLSIGRLELELEKVIGAEIHDEASKYLAFSTTDEMTKLLGEADIIAVSDRMTSRRYTFVDAELSFFFIKNSVERFRTGNVKIKDTAFIPHQNDSWPYPQEPVGEYYVDARKVCPGLNCPFDDRGSIKEAFKNLSAKEFARSIITSYQN